jgi:hypothetical protein
MVKRADLSTAIANDIGKRDFTGTGQGIATPELAEAISAPAVSAKKHKKKIELVRVRMDSGDFKKFQSVAYGLGTNASCLIRQYIKKVIKSGEA